MRVQREPDLVPFDKQDLLNLTDDATEAFEIKEALKRSKPSKKKGKGKKKGAGLPSADTSASSAASLGEGQRTEDYLNSILPPKEFTDAGQLWVQYVSPTPATRLDVINL